MSKVVGLDAVRAAAGAGSTAPICRSKPMYGSEEGSMAQKLRYGSS